MKLVEFSVERYRSIIQKSTIQIKDKTVIIGPNNEGKSNVLRALVVAQGVLEAISSRPRIINPRNVSSYYILHSLKSKKDVSFDWDNDYPHSLLRNIFEDDSLSPISFCMTFSLSEKDQEEFFSLTNIKMSTETVSAIIKINSRKALITFEVGSEIHSKIEDIIRIARFITKHIKVCYIDAIRTASTAYESIHRLLSIETESIDESLQYQQCINTITNLYNERFTGISHRVTESLINFVPNIRETLIELPKDNYEDYNYIDVEESVSVSINDGETTPLEQKGSGIQSLIALALAHSMSIKPSDSKNFVLAIEEPEAHLHPQGIHEIKKILFDIAKHNQLIITTHSPLLANTSDISSNVIVSNNIARAARNIKEIRDTLGIFASDNLMFADNNILVEGFSDERIIKTILMAISTKIEKAFNSDVLKIINCEGCSKVSSFVSLMKVYISRFYVILDGDKDGEDERKRLEEKDPSLSGSITSFHALGMRESEIEDYIDPDSYADKLGAAFSLNNMITLKQALNDVNKKWSERLSDYGAKNGHHFDDEKEIIQAKTIVADAVEEKKLDALRDCRKDIFYTLAANIEKMLDE